MNRLAIALVLLSALAVRAAEFQAHRWNLRPSGHLEVGGAAGPGTEVDVEDDFGYREEHAVGAGVVVGAPHQLEVDWLRLDLGAGNTTTRPISFGGLVFPSGVNLRSDVEGELFRAAYRFVAGSDTVAGGFLFGLQFLDVDAAASAQGLGMASESLDTLIPVVGGVLDWAPLPAVGTHLGVVGGSWNSGESGATFMDATLSARIQVRNFYAGVGYRHLLIDGEDDNVPLVADLKLSGPQFFAGIQF